MVQHSKFLTPLTNYLMDAAGEMGIPHRDYNGKFLTSSGIPQVTIKGARRWTVSSAYLQPVTGRSNLHILKNSLVRKILIDTKTRTVYGIEFETEGVVRSINAKREVILSAGAINSPKLLMLSGVGPKADLDNLGIEVVSDRPVGRNFHDHIQVRLNFKLNGKASITSEEYSSVKEMLLYAQSKDGVYAYNGFAAVMFFSLGQDVARDPPDAQLHVINYRQESTEQSIVTMVVNKAKPVSRGTVKLKNTDPSEPPLIDPRYYTDQKDLTDTVKALETTIKLMRTKAMSHLRPEIHRESHPHCPDDDDRIEFLKCITKYYSTTLYHPVGTVKMGQSDDNSSVVDPQLRVIGVGKLRVVDASIMPTIIRANTNAPTIMIAEKASDLIKQYHGLQQN